MSPETTSAQPTMPDVERVKREIYDEWQSPTILAAYRKWETHESAWGSKPSALLVEHAHVSPGMTVLDLASGHGEPALALAEAVGPAGHVTATDQGPGLLAIAEERALRIGLRNMTFRVADAHALPFPDGAFDRVTSRFGLMYFVELQRALRETVRVLKPGGRATFMVWDTPDQPFIEIFVGSLFRHIAPPEPEPGAPDPFMFAAPGTLSAALRDAGYRAVQEERAIVDTLFPGTPRQYWDWFWEMIPPLQPLLDALSPEQRQTALDEALTALRSYDDGERVVVPIHVVVGSGIR
jgi:ubiquinone/menaquinone biosynthesis C-methylase UbiE